MISKQNAVESGVEQKVRFLCSDSYCPFDKEEAREIAALKGKIDFVVSNPPTSEGDNGFTFRRMVLEGAKVFLKPGGIVLINASFQYGSERVLALVKPKSGYRYLGVAASTERVSFDLTRVDLLSCLRNYALEEHRGGMRYSFFTNAEEDERMTDARSALRNYEEHGVSPYTKWQTHLFQRISNSCIRIISKRLRNRAGVIRFPSSSAVLWRIRPEYGLVSGMLNSENPPCPAFE